MVEKQPQKPQEGSEEKEYFNCTQYGENEVKRSWNTKFTRNH